jgi:hypothetical protein
LIDIVAECNSLCHSQFHFATDEEEPSMIARLWRGWTAADSADEVAAHLRDVTLARFARAPGNHSVHMFRRPSAGGVELMTVTVWETDEAVPTGVAEQHRLLVASQTRPACWEIVKAPKAVVRAA